VNLDKATESAGTNVDGTEIGPVISESFIEIEIFINFISQNLKLKSVVNKRDIS
jgi:hypothetical protein